MLQAVGLCTYMCPLIKRPKGRSRSWPSSAWKQSQKCSYDYVDATKTNSSLALQTLHHHVNVKLSTSVLSGKLCPLTHPSQLHRPITERSPLLVSALSLRSLEVSGLEVGHGQSFPCSNLRLICPECLQSPCTVTQCGVEGGVVVRLETLF